MQPCNLNKIVFLIDKFTLIVANNTPKTIECDKLDEPETGPIAGPSWR